MKKHYAMFFNAIMTFFTSPKLISNQNITPETISDTADIYAEAMRRALKEADKQTPSHPSTVSEDSRAKEIGTEKIKQKLLNRYHDNWDWEANLPGGFDYSSMDECLKTINKWHESGAITSGLRNKLFRTLDRDHFGWNRATGRFSDLRNMFRLETQMMWAGLKSTLARDVDPIDPETEHESTPITHLLTLMCSEGGLGYPMHSAMALGNRLDPTILTLTSPSQSLISDYDREVPPDSPLGKEIGRIKRDRNKYSIESVKKDRTSFPMLSELIREIKPDPREIGTMSSDDTQYTDSNRVHVEDPLDFDKLFDIAATRRWEDMLSYEDESFALEHRLTNAKERYAFAAMRESHIDHSLLSDIVPHSPMSALLVAPWCPRTAAQQMLKLPHIARRVLDADEPERKIPERQKELLAIHGQTAHIVNMASHIGTTARDQISHHSHGTNQPLQNKQLRDIQNKYGVGLQYAGDGAVNEQGTSKSSAQWASHGYGVRDSKSRVSDEGLLEKAIVVFKMHLIGGAHSEIFRYGEDAVSKLKKKNFPDADGLLGKPVIAEPGGFQELLKHAKRPQDIPNEWLTLETPFYDEGDLRHLWSEALSSSKEYSDNRGVQYGMPSHWKDTLADEQYMYRLQAEKDAYGDIQYYLPLKETGKEYSFPEGEEPRIAYGPEFLGDENVVPWREGVQEKTNAKLWQWLQGQKSAASTEFRGRPPTLFSLRETYDLDPEDNAESSVGRFDTRKKLMVTPRLKIHPSNVVRVGVEGVPVMIGEHPSVFLSEWADEVVSKVPQSPTIEGLADDMIESAKTRANHEIGQSKFLGDITDDELGGNSAETVERDYRRRSGLTTGTLDLALKDMHNASSSISMLFDLVAGMYARQHSANSPEEYEGLGPSETFDKFWKDNILLHDNLNTEGEKARLIMHDKIRNTCIRILNQVSPREHVDDDKGGNYRSSELIENLIHEHMQWMGDDMHTHYTGHNYINNLLRPAVHETSSGYYDRRITHSTSPTKSRRHPMSQVMTRRGDRQALGHEILREYILSNDHVGEILHGLGMSTEEALEKLGDLVKSTSDYKPIESLAENLTLMRQVGNHRLGEEPLGWWRKAMTTEWEHYRKEKDKRKSEERAHKEGFETKSGEYIPTLSFLAQRQGVYAQQSKELRQNLLRSIETDYEGFWDTVGFLLHRNRNGDNIMDIIRKDLATLKVRDKRAFPEHYNSLGRSVQPNDIQTSARHLAHFLFCEGSTDNASDQVRLSRPHSDSRGVRELPIGLRYTSLKPSISRATITNYGEWAQNNLSRTLDISGSKIPTLHTNYDIRNHFGEHTEFDGSPHTLFNETATSEMRPEGFPPSDTRDLSRRKHDNVEAVDTPVDVLTSLDVLTDIDLLLKEEDDKGKEKGDPLPIKAMHRIFTLKDLEHLRGFSGDWVVSSWPEGNRLMVRKKKDRIQSYNHMREAVTLPNKVKEGLKDSFDKGFLLDCVWDGDVLHIVDILESGKEKMDNSPTKDRNRHLRTNFSATEEVSIPAPINTKRVDSEGLDRAVEDLFKEAGTKQILLRDADATCMRGEIRHPKWVMLTPEHQIDVRVVYSRGGKHCLGIGPILTEDALEIGNRARKLDGEHYMDVGKLTHSGTKKGDYITVKITGVSARKRNGLKIYTLQSPRYLKNSESGATDSIDSLEIIQNKRRGNLPHKVRVKKGSIHIDSSVGHVVYDTEPEGNAFILKDADAPNDYVLRLVESQVEYWEPLAAVLLRAEAETKKEKKANVVPEPPANHDKKPKKVLKPSERLLKDPKLTKQLTTALETLDAVLKEKITWTGPKGMGIDYATPVESPSGPTKLTEPHHLPDHDPGHRQKKGGDCWCGAKKGQLCAQGMGHKMEQCPEAHPPKKEKKSRHLRVSRDS